MKDCQFGVSPVNHSDSDSDSDKNRIGPLFAHLFQQSIDSGEIPKIWTLKNISPLFNKSDRSLACNYRPVSSTCVPCKLLEHTVCSNMAHLDEHKLQTNSMHSGSGIAVKLNKQRGDELNKLIAFVQIPFCLFIYVCL